MTDLEIDWDQPMICIYGCGFEGTLGEVVDHQIQVHAKKDPEVGD